MQKQAPSLGRILVMVGFALSCFGLLLFLWVAFGGSVPLKAEGYRFKTSFGEATQLAKEADVRISGVSVGKVKTIEPDKKSGRSQVVIEMRNKYAPIAKDTKAILRQKTLLGETYVELTPGDGKKAGFVKENGFLPAGQVSKTVELDEIFRTFDQRTRDAFDNWMQTQAVALKGRGGDINNALGNLSSFADDTNVLLRVLDDQKAPVRALVRNTGVVFDALSARQGQLKSLIGNSNQVFRTTAERNADLQDAFRTLPDFEKKATATTNRLTAYADNTNPLINQLRPAARELSPTLQDLGRLSPDAKTLFRRLDPLITVSKRGLPATRKFLDQLKPLLGEFDPTLTQLNPILAYLGLYKKEINAFFANVVASTEATNTPAGAGADVKVHYLRTTNPLNAENLAIYSKRLPTNRSNPYALPGYYDNVNNGLAAFDTRNCSNGAIPFGLTGKLAAILPPAIAKQLTSSLGNATNSLLTSTVAPPCKQQGKFTINGKSTSYPQLSAGRDVGVRASNGG